MKYTTLLQQNRKTLLIHHFSHTNPKPLAPETTIPDTPEPRYTQHSPQAIQRIRRGNRRPLRKTRVGAFNFGPLTPEDLRRSLGAFCAALLRNPAPPVVTRIVFGCVGARAPGKGEGFRICIRRRRRWLACTSRERVRDIRVIPVAGHVARATIPARDACRRAFAVLYGSRCLSQTLSLSRSFMPAFARARGFLGAGG